MKKVKLKTSDDTNSEKSSLRLTELSEKARNEAGSGAENHFMEPQSEPKKFRGRHRNDCECEKCVNRRATRQNVIGAHDKPQLEDLEKIKTYLKPAVLTVSSVGVRLAETQDAKMSDIEVNIIVDSAASVISHYLPGLLGEHTDLIVLISCFSQWGVRVYFLRQQRLSELKEEYKRQNAGKPVQESQAVAH